MQSTFEVQVMDSPARGSNYHSIRDSHWFCQLHRIQVATSLTPVSRTANCRYPSWCVNVARHERCIRSTGSGRYVIVASNGAAVIETGDIIDVEFFSEHGDLELMISTGSEIITKLQTGEAPFRSKRQSIQCNANGDYVVLSFNGNTATIDIDDMLGVEAKLSTLVLSAVSIVEVDDSISNVCDPALLANISL